MGLQVALESCHMFTSPALQCSGLGLIIPQPCGMRRICVLVFVLASCPPSGDRMPSQVQQQGLRGNPVAESIYVSCDKIVEESSFSFEMLSEREAVDCTGCEFFDVVKKLVQ